MNTGYVHHTRLISFPEKTPMGWKARVQIGPSTDVTVNQPTWDQLVRDLETRYGVKLPTSVPDAVIDSPYEAKDPEEGMLIWDLDPVDDATLAHWTASEVSTSDVPADQLRDAISSTETAPEPESTSEPDVIEIEDDIAPPSSINEKKAAINDRSAVKKTDTEEALKRREVAEAMDPELVPSEVKPAVDSEGGLIITVTAKRENDDKVVFVFTNHRKRGATVVRSIDGRRYKMTLGGKKQVKKTLACKKGSKVRIFDSFSGKTYYKAEIP